ncbi:hypothetical protein L6164_013378 [Bauhinia variegata]|uniref:Uncharacterized protein n=1 Tax=Bauhinia variegata TaxID=167791 RepID=A0ACB9NE06_BAUVA|nr:hypothetical protein L6164_013378 [Bauhinia variegata]
MRMKKSTKWVWVSFLIILLVEGWFCEGCWKQERDALLHLQAQFNEPVGYDISDCCLWDYVECNNTTRRVARLTLSGRWYKWVGNWYLNISDFQAFEALESLDLSFNSILGCVQNKGAGSAENLSFSFSNLKHLDLGHNFLNNSGILSSSKGTLSWPSNFEVLDLSYNSFGNDIISSFRELKYLKQLDLSGNQLEGSVDINELYGLTKLEILDLSYNNISSVVARQGIKMSLSNVSALHLDGCKIDGNMLRKSLRPFPYIKNIYLNQNQFKGTILARDFGELNNLEHLELSFSSNITNEFFESIGSLTSLKVLSMRSCGINGTLPIGGKLLLSF